MSGGRIRAIILGLGITLILVVIIFGRPKSAPTNTNTTNDTSRTTYAAAYDGLWRQDSGQSSVLVTATMFPPFLRSDLDQAASKTSEESQIWLTMESMPSTNVPIVITLDSVSGSLPDEVVSKSLSLDANSANTFSLKSWTPLTGSSHIVNASSGAASQIGVAVFTSDHAIDWNNPPQFTLHVKGIAGAAKRDFVWTSAVLQAPSR